MRRSTSVMLAAALMGASFLVADPAGAASSSSSPVVPTCGSQPISTDAMSHHRLCPNGTLVYVRYLDQPDLHIQTINLRTGKTRNVGNDATIVQTPDGPATTSSSEPSFSPDGHWIAYSSAAPNAVGYTHVWLVRTDGSDNHRLTSTSIGGEQYPVFSPDGKYVYYTAPGAAAGEGNSNLWRARIDGRDRRQITHVPDSMDMYQLNRAGNKLAFVTLQGIDAPIYTMNLDGTGRAAVPNTGGAQSPHLNPKATALVFYTPYGAPGIMTVNLNGSHLLDRTPGATYEQPSWSPDGKQFACIDENQNLFIMNSDGTNLRQVGSFGAVQDPSWQPAP